MKKIAVFLTFAILLSFVSCDTTSHYTLKVSVDREPVLTVENKTGYPVVVTAPVSLNMNNEAITQFQPTETNRSINVTYRIGQIEFTEQVTMNNADTTVTLTRRPPTVTVINQTGYTVAVFEPLRVALENGARHQFLSPVLNQIIDVNYRIDLMEFTEQVTIGNRDVTITLTRRPPIITVVNNVGATINTLFMRPPGSGTPWIGGNLVRRRNVVSLVDSEGGGAEVGDISESIVNLDRMSVWTGFVQLRGNVFDIRIDDVRGNSYVKTNVQVINDITLTFTASDRR